MIRRFGNRDVFVTVVSARRSTAVVPMNAMVGPATWIVGENELATYFGAGASVVVEAGTLCKARNMALQLAFEKNLPCLQLSDDLKKIEQPVWSAEKGKHVSAPLTFDESVVRVLDGLSQTSARYAGVAPTSNPFFYRGKTVHPKAFIVGDYSMVLPCDLRFDEGLLLKEDYDYTLQHLKAFGMVARRDDVLVTFVHRTNGGGAVAYRTDQLEKETIAYLKNKWGGVVRDNPKRPNEVLLRL